MFFTATRKKYFDKIRATTNFDNTPFYFLPSTFQDETLDFDKRLKQYYNEKKQELQLENNKSWIGVIWRRSAVSECNTSIQYKKIEFVVFNDNDNEPAYDIFSLRLSSVKFETAFYSNDPDYLENLEENVFLDIPINFTLNVPYPSISNTAIFKNLVTSHVHTSIVKEEREKVGTLSKLQTDCIFNFAIVKKVNTIKGVKSIQLDGVRTLDQAMADFQIIINK